MRITRILLLALATALPCAWSGETTLEVAKGETAGQLVRRVAERLDAIPLYPASGAAGLDAGGPHLLTLPEDRLLEGVRFLLSLRQIDLRAVGQRPTLLTMVGREAMRPEYKTPALDLTLYFNRTPAQWEREEDLADSLAADTVAELMRIVRTGEPPARACAALLLGRAGPPSPPVIACLREGLAAEDAAVRHRAALALASIGYPARAALAEVEALAEREAGPFVEAARRLREAPHPALFSPTLARERAPDRFRVRFTTTKGPFVVEVERAWAPNGADRLFNLVRIGYYSDVALFRVIPRFVAQWGIHGDPRVNALWRTAKIPDDPVVIENDRGTVVFATAAGEAGSRTVQVFVNTGDNRKSLDRLGFAPFGRVVEGLEVVERLHAGYGDGPPQGRGPLQSRMQGEGNRYLAQEFPDLDRILSAAIE